MVDQYGNWYQDFPGQQPMQDPAFVRMIRQQQGNTQQQNNQPQQTSQQMTPPTIHADIIQVKQLSDMDSFQVVPGTAQMFITQDNEHIAIRDMYANNQHSDRIFDMRPPEPPAPTLNPADYVRKDELMGYISQIIEAKQQTETEA